LSNTKIKPPRQILPRFSDRLSWPEIDFQISPFCLGMVKSEDTYCCAFDAGINFFFITADMHWPVYDDTRKSLSKLLSRGRGIRDQIVVAGVSYCTQPEFCIGPFEEALQAVPQLDRFDMLIAGGSYAHEIMTRHRVYQHHRQNHFVNCQAIGTTCHDRQVALDVVNNNYFDICFVRYNPLHPGARSDLFPFMSDDSLVPLFNFKNTVGHIPPRVFKKLGLADDHWAPEMTDYYKFALARPEIKGLLCSPTTPEEVEELADAMEGPPLTSEVEEYLGQLGELVREQVKSESTETY